MFRGTTKKIDENKFTIEALLSLNEIGNLVENGYQVLVKEESSKKFRAPTQSVPFQKWFANTQNKLQIMNETHQEFIVGNKYLDSEGFDKAHQYIFQTYQSIVDLIVLPEKSCEGRTINCLRIHAKSDKDNGARNGILILGGVHAREIVNPDLLVTLSLNICNAYTSKTGLRIGNSLFDYELIKKMVEGLDIFIFPLVNPDGRVHVQSSENGEPRWRKNMNPNPNSHDQCSEQESEGIKSNTGVDLNRNYDFLWSSGIGSRKKTCSINYRGSSPFSEPETKNVKYLVDNFPTIKWLIDVHSSGQTLLYPWGFDEDQNENPDMSFLNSSYDGMRGSLNDKYKEYIRRKDLDMYLDLGNKMLNAIINVRNNNYTLQQSALTGLTSASSDDYCYSQSYIHPNDRRIMSYTLETANEFQPDFFEEGSDVIKEVSAGLLQFCLSLIETQKVLS
jgi:carboxypeptidase T